MSIKDLHHVTSDQSKMMEKLYELYFDESYQDKKLFIQEAINAVGSFLHVSIYLYEKSYDQKVCIYRYHEPMAKAIDDSMLETYHKNMLENVHQVHLYPLVIDGMNIGYIYFDMNDLPENHQEFIERFIYILILKLKEDQNQQEIEKLREDNQKLEQTKQQFLANISHEIKTPLSGVYNALYLLNSTDLSDEQKAYHKIGSSSIEQLSSILDDLLDIKKISSGKMEVYKDTFNLEDEMIRVIKMHQLLASEKQIELNISFNHQINFECIGDFRKIRQIVSQLVHNAIKFTQKGFVSLDIMLDTKHEQQILLKVKDSGIGMDEQQVKNIFDMFYQADQKDTRAYQGTGLGLSVTYQLIKLLQGDICVSSVVDQGTEFIVTIPIEKGRVFDYQSLMKSHVLLYDDLNEQEESIFHALGFKVYKQTTIGHSKVDYIVYTKHSHEKDDVEQHKKRYGKPQVLTILFDGVSEKQALYDFVFEKPVSLSVIYQRLLMKKNQMTQAEQYSKLLHAYALIVDDNRLNRVALSNILKKMGLKSKQADSGKAAIEMVKKEAFDCILMDVQMPEMDGIEATRRIRSLGKNYQQIPIIAVTANAFLKDYDVMKTAQITDVIFKPINIDHLEQVLRKYIQSSNDIFIPHDLFVFDQEDFNHRFEGSNDIGNEVLHTFLSEYPKDMKRIHEAIKAQDFKQIEHETHYFKGSCAYLSAKRVVWVLTYMVEHARLNHIDEINDAYPFLSNEIERLIEEIKEYHL